MKLVIYLIPILLVLNGLAFGQERFLMDQNTFQKFKQAKRMYEKGEQLFLKGDLEGAEGVLEKCVETFPKYSEAYFILAQVNYKKKEFPAGLDFISSAKAHFKYMSDLRVSTQMEYITTLQERSQKLKDLMRELEEKLSRATSDATRSRINSSIGLTKGQLNQIENRLHSPIPNIENLPAEYYYVHGNILFKLKRLKDAHQQYLEAVKVDPKHGNALNNLSTMYYMAKNFQKAKEYLDQAEASGMTVNEKYKNALLKALEE